MSEQIKIHKNTLVLFTVFIAALALAFAYFSFLGKTLENGNNNGNAQNCSEAQKCDSAAAAGALAAEGKDFQEVYLKASGLGYDKNEITVKKGIPVRLHFTADNAGCGSALIIQGLNVKAVSQGGLEAVVEFTPNNEGTYQYNCPMRMFPPGRFVVV